MGTKLLLPVYVTVSLKCDLCKGYLSVPPISSYEEKFSCGRCNPGWPRNVIYEELAQFMMFPCTFCEEQIAYGEMAKHETDCKFNVFLCPASYEKNYIPRRLPTSPLEEYHKECQTRTLRCPFDLCDMKCAVADVAKHFEKFHKKYVFSSDVTARKILKEEKVWNFSPDNQVCLVIFKRTPLFFFVHGDCDYDDSTGDIICYNYYFAVFSLCDRQSDLKYSVSLTMESSDANPTPVISQEEQEVKPFRENLHRVNFLRNGLAKFGSFNFMTTRFERIRKTDGLVLCYEIKMADGAADMYEKPGHNLKIENLGRKFECPICKEYLTAPVFNCQNGHSVCKACRSKMALCPFCKACIGDSRNFALEDILESLQITCQNEDRGCEYFGRVREIAWHELKCPFVA